MNAGIITKPVVQSILTTKTQFNMKKVLLATFFLAASSFFSYIQAQADDNDDAHNITLIIPEVALLDIETSGSKDLSFSATAPDEAGDSLSFDGLNDSTLWLNYTSIKSAADPTRNITVDITSGTVPANTTLKVLGKTSQTGFGGLGTSAGELDITDGSVKNLVTGITSCYTRNGVNRGSQLRYTWELTGTANYGDLLANDPAGTTITVTYTLTDN